MRRLLLVLGIALLLVGMVAAPALAQPTVAVDPGESVQIVDGVFVGVSPGESVDIIDGVLVTVSPGQNVQVIDGVFVNVNVVKGEVVVER